MQIPLVSDVRGKYRRNNRANNEESAFWSIYLAETKALMTIQTIAVRMINIPSIGLITP